LLNAKIKAVTNLMLSNRFKII